MARLFRLLCAVAAIPLAWGVTHACADVLRVIPVSGSHVLPPELTAAFAGCLAYLVVWLALPPGVRVYVLGHELTHALFGLFFGARPSNLRVGLHGGSVTLTKSNVWITLAPYFFPFYTILVVCAALVVRCFVTPLPWPCAWLFAVGFTWCFHCRFTLRSLCQEQPDAREYGYVFSYVFIWIFNVLGVATWVVCTTEVPWAVFGRRLFVRVASSYGLVGELLLRAYESLRSLPVLQG